MGWAALAVGFRFFSNGGWPITVTWDTGLGRWGGSAGECGGEGAGELAAC